MGEAGAKLGALMLAAVAGPAMGAPPELASGAWHCTFTERQRCDGRGCVTVAPAARTILAPSQGLYLRCGGGLDGCDYYDASFAVRGNADFLTVDVAGQGIFAKLSTDLVVTDVVSLGHLIIIGRGRCEAGPLPAAQSRPSADS